MKKTLISSLILIFIFSVAQISFAADHNPGEHVSEKSRCAVCGMFVAKYPEWLTELQMSGGQVVNFDGVKDMMAYYFSPQKFGAEDGTTAIKVSVKDYYTQIWIDGKTAFYVAGGDVYGPMGHELIPFSSQEAAESFLKDHHGKKIYGFSEIGAELIESMRKGHKMKGDRKDKSSMSGMKH